MTITINIEAHPDRGDMRGQIDNALSALGFVRESRTVNVQFDVRQSAGGALSGSSVAADKTDKPATEDVYDESGGIVARAEGWAPGAEQVEAAIASENAFPVRERGKAGAGRTRRTKIEIAEDEAADAADAQAAAAAKDAGIQADSAEDVKPAISTGNERIGPEDAATAAQDKADEDAEAAAGKTGLTRDDLRIAVGAYQRKFGMAAAIADVQQILGCKQIDVTLENLQWAVSEMERAVKLNPYARDFVGGDRAADVVQPEAEAEAAPAIATKQDVIDAMIAYAKKYDGPGADPADAASMPFANEDFPRLFKMIFGEKVDRLGLIPATPEDYGKALAGVIEMTVKDGFKRGAK